jgi:tetratricopeptide (TPR) repeat protein
MTFVRSLTLSAVAFVGLFGFSVASNSAVGATIQDNDAAQAIALTASNAQNAGSYDFAAEQWEKLISQHATSPLVGKAHYNAGICFLQSNKFEKAIGHFQSALPKLENDQAFQKPQANLYLGFAQFRLGQQLKPSNADESNKQLTTATQTLGNLIKDNPKFEDADQVCYFQGGAFEELNRLEDALAAYTKMLSYPKQTFKLEGLYAVADMHDQLGQYAKALEYFEKVQAAAKADKSPLVDEIQWRTGSTLMSLATADENRGEKDAAVAKLNRAQTMLSELVNQDAAGKGDDFARVAEDAKFELAFCSRRLGQFEKSAQLFDAIGKNAASPLAAESLLNAGRNWIDAGKPELAKPLLEKIVATDPTNANLAAHWLAGLLLKSGNAQSAYDLATKQIAKTATTDAANSSTFVALLMDQADAAFEIPEKRKDSIAMFDALASKHPEHSLAPSALHSSAFTSLDQNDFDTAIKTATSFESKYPESEFLPDTLEVKAESLLLSDKPEEAANVFDQLVSKFNTHKNHSRWKIRSGLAAYMNENYKATIEKLSPVVATLDDAESKSEALFWIGSSQFQLKDNAAAAKSLADSYATNKKWKRTEETLLTLCRAQLANDQPTKGIATANTLINDFPESNLLSDAHYYLGEQAYEAKKFDDAFKHFDTINQRYADSKFAPYALYNAAWSQLELKKYKESEALFSSLISKFPNHELAKQAKIGRGASRRKTGDTDSSIADLSEFLKTNPEGKARTNALYELALAQVETKKWDDAIGTFKTLIAEDADSPRADRYFYELAWAYRYSEKEDLALEYFTKLTSEKKDSPLAAEANFHVGTAAYDKGNFDDAIKAYTLCVNSETADNIREKAAYKLAWANYKQDQFQAAHDEFANQVKLFKDGELYADGMFMVGESMYRLKNYEQALSSYQAAKPIVETSTQVEPKIKWLTMLHGAQSANKLKRYNDALALVKTLDGSSADVSFKQDAWLEMGAAHAGLSQTEEAIAYYRKAADNLGKTGARARCMIGDMLFKDKKFEPAVDEFKLVFYGFGGKQAAAEVRPWQAYAIYEAARCSFVQVEGAPKELKPKLVAEAIKHFEYLLENYSDDRLAAEAKRQLETLKKLDVS